MLGRIDVVTGCMFAGKSGEALQKAQQARAIGIPVVAIKHSFDTRFSAADGLSTHARRSAEFPAIAAPQLLPVRGSAEYRAAELVVIDEAQFFDDLVAFCVTAAETDGKEVAVFGLDGTFERAPFGQIAQLCPLADTFVKRQALCQFCKTTRTLAPFTLALREMPDSGVLIGGKTEYAAVCRHHYLAHTAPME